MKQFYMAKEAPITTERLGKILSEFQTHHLPIFKRRYNYYLGKQDILLRTATDAGKPCNKIVCNYVKNIVETYEGYAVGIPITYDNEVEGFEELDDILKANDVVDEDAEFFRKGLIFGRAPEIFYFDEEGKVRFKMLSPMECLPVYDDTLNNDLLYAIRFWSVDLVENLTPSYMVEVYDRVNVTTYKSSMNFSSFEFVGQKPHNFQQVPVTFFSLNDEEEGIADCIFSLQDAYNALLSDSLDDWDSFCDAYLVLKGVTADGEDLRAMKEQRAFSIDQDADVDFLVKNTQTTEIENLLTTVEEKIREMAACPNFASEIFGTSSGIAIRYRLMGMNNAIKAIESNFKKALQKRIEILADISGLINGEEALWRDVDIHFTANIPENAADIAAEINSFRGLVSDRTLLAQVPFVTDVDAELEELRKEKQENLILYDFGGHTEEEEDNELLDRQATS